MICHLPVHFTEKLEERHWEDVRSSYLNWVVDSQFPLSEWIEEGEAFSLLRREVIAKSVDFKNWHNRCLNEPQQEILERVHQSLKQIVLAKPHQLESMIKKMKTIEKESPSQSKGMFKPYTNFRNRNWALELLQHLNIKVCPYCNRQYVHTVVTKKGKKVVTPHFDHFYPKSLYPFLQVSLYNLIPSCATCNLKKSDDDPYHECTGQCSGVCNCRSFSASDFHPYVVNEARDDIAFEIDWSNIQDVDTLYGFESVSNLNVRLRGMTTAGDQLASYLNKNFGISEIMSVHRDVVLEMIQKIQVYDQRSIEYIEDRILEQQISVESARHLLFGDYLDDSLFHERSLGKLKRDLYQSLEWFWRELRD